MCKEMRDRRRAENTEWERLEISSENERYQGSISCKDGHSIKHRYGMDLTEAEDIKKR